MDFDRMREAWAVDGAVRWFFTRLLVYALVAFGSMLAFTLAAYVLS